MPRKIFPFFTVFVILAVLLTSCERGPSEFYVSTEGHPDASGSLDDPFGSIEQAQRIIQHHQKDRQITVFLRDGIYPIAQSLQFGPDDSGSENSPVIWKSYPGERALLSGGQQLKDFVPLTDPIGLERVDPQYHANILQIDLSKYALADFGSLDPRSGNRMELYFNGEFMSIARYPNEDWLKIASVPQTGVKGYVKEPSRIRYGIPVGKHFGRFQYETDRPAQWRDQDDIWMHGYWVWDWSDEFQKVAQIDKVNKEIYPSEPYHRYGYHEKQRFYFLNILEELDQPGEWYLDKKTRILYFWPPSSIEGADVWLSTSQEPLIQCSNTTHLIFQDLDIKFSRGNAIDIDGGEHVRIQNSIFTNLGGLPVKINGGHNHVVSGCEMHNLAMGGILIEGGDRATLTPGNHKADNNHIHHFAQRVKTYQPAIAARGVGNTISHNLIHDAPHMAIGFAGNEHIIEYNEVHHVLTETSDAGAVYNGRDWTERGTIIRYNYFHDLGATIEGEGFHGVMGVYLDDCLPGTLIQGNIFQNIDRGIMLGGGQYNQVINNIFLDCDLAIHVDARAKGWARKYAVEGGGWEMRKKLAVVDYQNPPWSTTYPELVNILNKPYSPIGIEISHNISQGGRWLDMLQGTDFDTIQISNNLVSHEEIVKWSNPIHPEGKIYTYNGDDMVHRTLEDNGNILSSPDEKMITLHANQLEILKPQLSKRIGFESISLDDIGLQGSMKKEMLRR